MLPNVNTDDYSRMVVGFVFDEGFRNVLLVNKQSPDWQRGFYNGIGGKKKHGEAFEEAIVRETFEESEMRIDRDKWAHFVTLYTGGKPGTAPTVEVRFYFAVVDRCEMTAARQSPGGEPLIIIPRRALQDYKTVPNLQWMIPLAVNWNEGLLPYEYAQPFEVRERRKSS